MKWNTQKTLLRKLNPGKRHLETFRTIFTTELGSSLGVLRVLHSRTKTSCIMLEGAGLRCDQLGAEQVITPVQRSGRLSNTPKRTNKHKEKSSLKQKIKTCPAGLQCLMRRCKMFRSFMLCAAQRQEAGL